MKESFYFTHDYYARNSPKLVELRVAHGMAGLGVFWCIIEMLHERGGKMAANSCKSIAYELRADSNIVEDVLHNYGLFQIDDDYITSNSVLRRIEKREEIAKKRSKAAKASWNKRNERQCNANASNSDANALGCNAILNISSNEDIKNISPNGDIGKENGKISPNGDKRESNGFIPPSLAEVKEYFSEKGFNSSAETFFNYYEGNGWMVGVNKMQLWKPTADNWEKREKTFSSKPVNRVEAREQASAEFRDYIRDKIVSASQPTNDTANSHDLPF